MSKTERATIAEAAASEISATAVAGKRPLGIDVSRWQEQMAWPVTAAAGVKFALSGPPLAHQAVAGYRVS